MDPRGRECVNGVSSSDSSLACFTNDPDPLITSPYFSALAAGVNRAAPYVETLTAATPFMPVAATAVALAVPAAPVVAAATTTAVGAAETPQGQKAVSQAETFFRTMSETHFEQLSQTSQVPATAETFVTPSLQYAQQYSGVTVQFSVEAGTTQSLLDIGVRNVALTGSQYSSLPLVQRGWGAANAFFKLEGGTVNVGLGTGSALRIFNSNIRSFNAIPK